MPNDDLEVFHLLFPRKNRMDLMVSHPGQEYCYVISGRIRFHVGAEIFELAAGEGIFLNSELPHRADNIGEDEARILMVVAKSSQAKSSTKLRGERAFRLVARAGRGGRRQNPARAKPARENDHATSGHFCQRQASALRGKAHRRHRVGDHSLARRNRQDAVSPAARTADRAKRRDLAARTRRPSSDPQSRFRAGLVHPLRRIRDRRQISIRPAR